MSSILFAAALAASSAWAGPELSAAYHGDFLTHPGASGRASWTLTGAERARLAWEAETGAWWHPKNIAPIYVRTGPAVRLEGKRNGTWGAFVHAGAAYGIYAATTYVLDQGELKTRPFSGEPWAIVASGLELGRNTPDAAIDGWFVRPQVGLRIPTFHGYGIDLAVQAGVRFGGAR